MPETIAPDDKYPPGFLAWARRVGRRVGPILIIPWHLLCALGHFVNYPFSVFSHRARQFHEYARRLNCEHEARLDYLRQQVMCLPADSFITITIC